MTAAGEASQGPACRGSAWKRTPHTEDCLYDPCMQQPSLPVLGCLLLSLTQIGFFSRKLVRGECSPQPHSRVAFTLRRILFTCDSKRIVCTVVSDTKPFIEAFYSARDVDNREQPQKAVEG